MKKAKLLFLIVFIILSQGISLNIGAQPSNPGSSRATLFDPVSFLQEYISVPSVSGDESMAAEFLSSACESYGLNIRHFSKTDTAWNFIASLYPLESSKPNIIFENHMDVVSPGDTEDWESHPFKGNIRDGKVYGRGAIDNKGLAVLQLKSILNIMADYPYADLPFNVSLLCVSGEETGGIRGSKIVSCEYAGELNAALVLGEGACGLESLSFIKTDKPVFGISIAEKGILWVELKAEDELTGHASIQHKDYPNKRLINALDKILKYKQPVRFTEASRLMFRELGKNEKGIRGFAMRHFNWIIFKPIIKHYIKVQPELKSLLCNTITLSNLYNPEGDPNQAASQAVATLDCRLLPGNSYKKMIDWIKRKVKNDGIQVNIICEGPPSLTTLPDTYFKNLEASIKEIYKDAIVIPVLFPASADNNYYRQAGIPAYGINPHFLSMEQISSIHNANENIDAKEIRSGAAVFTNFLRKMMETSVIE
jgi:carboxypeptidase PM20D1